MPARSFLMLLITCVTVLLVMPGRTFAGTPDTVTPMLNLALAGAAGIASDTSGNLYIADTANNQIIMVDTAAPPNITRFGSGVAGFVPFTNTTVFPTGATIGDAAVQFNAPAGIATDSNGDVYVADTGNNRIHMIVADTTTKLISAASLIVTVAGSGTGGFSGDDAPAVGASLNRPTGVAVDASLNIYIADNGNYRIRMTTVGGNISTLAGDGTATKLTAYGIAFSPAGDLYIADAGNNRILKMTAGLGVPSVFAGNGTAGFSGDGGLASLAQLNQPSGVVTNGQYLYIADTMNSCVRRVSLATNVISTRLGAADKFSAITAPDGFSNPASVVLDAVGTLYVEDTGNEVIQQVHPSISAITTATPPGGSYSTAQSVVLTSQKAANIYYTTDGSAPSGSSTLYTAAIPISATTTLRFTSIDYSGNQEVINSATYTIDTIAPSTSITINATPVIDVYYSALSTLAVSFTSNEPNTSVYYTTNGTVPTTAANLYTIPVPIPVTATLTTTTVQFFGVDAAGLKGNIQSQKYQIIALTTAASPAGGAYSVAKNVTLTANNPSAAIYYTLNGTDPTTASAVYAGPVAIAANSTLKYRAKDANGNLEQTKSQVYTIDSTLPTLSVSPVGGTFGIPQTVTLTSDKPNVTIYYTTTGISPTSSSSKYSAPLAIAKTTTLMYFGVDAVGNKSVVAAQTYIIDTVAPITTASVPSGSYSSIQSVTLTTDDPTATTYYTTNGNTPTLSSPKYTAPIAISATTTLKYFSIDSIGNLEQIKSQLYTIDVIPPNVSVSPVGGTFRLPQTVTLTSNKPNTVIYYTTTGLLPTTTSSKYSAALAITKTTTLMYFGVDAAGNKSAVGAQAYIIDAVAPITTASVPSGTYSSIQSVTLTTDDPTATIYFTVDGSTPTDASTKYTSPIIISGPTVLQYFAKDISGNSELVKNRVYTINTLTTSASPKGGLFFTPQTVALLSNNPGATIYYTTDGTAPSTDTTMSKTTQKYSKPLLLQGYKTTLKFFSVDAMGVVENIKTEEYVINSLTTTVSPKGGMFNSPLAVTLKSSNTGATIYYTLDGTTPSNDVKLSKTTHSYTSPLYVQNGKTILKFFSLDAKGVSENVNTEIYTVDSAPPSATAKCGVTANSIELSARDGDDLLPEILYSTSNSASATGTPFTYYTAPIIFTLNTIVRFFAVDSAGNVGQMETVSCPAVVAPLDLKPALYLETATDRSTTSNGSLYVTGNVDPSTTITINGTAATTNADGSFFHKIQLAIGENTITTVATRGAQSSSETRRVSYVIPGPQTHDPLIAIGTGNGVVGHRVRVPIALTSGYQAATVSIDLDTTTFGGVLSTPTVEIAQSAAARGKFIQIAPPSASVYKIVITDINQPADGVTKRAPLPEGAIAYLTLSVISPNSVSEPLTVKEYSAKDLDNNVMTVNAVKAQTHGTVNIVSKPGNAWNTFANAEVPVTLKDALDALYMLLDPVTYPVSGSADLDADGRVQINELQQVIISLIGL